MPIYQAIDSFKQRAITSEADAQHFLNLFPIFVQQQFIAALYHGRDHIHATFLRMDVPINRSNIDHIAVSEYASIIHEKGQENIITYLTTLVCCANNSGYNLNQL